MKMSYEEFANKLERDWFLNAEEALNLGIVDEILQSKP
jgi:ATP-dependent protease ClpP protease subunit